MLNHESAYKRGDDLRNGHEGLRDPDRRALLAVPCALGNEARQTRPQQGTSQKGKAHAEKKKRDGPRPSEQ